MNSFEHFLGPGGQLCRVLKHYEFRPAQLEMAEAVGRAFQTCRSLLVEAGTGTGKTLAYLLPAILSGRKVVISTATKNLQEQILLNDVPLLEQALGQRISIVTLKGISNYLCRRRFGEALRDRGQGDLFDEGLLQMQQWVATSEAGDRSEMVGLDEALWTRAMSTTETRLGQRCPYHEECFVTLARQRAQEASIVVVNHALFFADLRIRSQFPEARLIPDYDLVVFDEAHQLEDFATRAFAIQLSSRRFSRLLRDLERAAARLTLPTARAAWLALHLNLSAAVKKWTDELGRFPMDESGRAALPNDTAGIDDSLFHCAQSLSAVLARIDAQPNELSEPSGWLLLRRVANLRDEIEQFRLGLTDPSGEASGVARWLETTDSPTRAVDLFCAPVDVSGTIRQDIVERVDAAVFASGTLTVGGDFGYFRRRWGLSSVSEARFVSPFDYAAQAVIYVPRDLPLPSENGYLEALASRMALLTQLTSGRAFLLFSSWRNLRAVHQAIAGTLGGPVLVQGQMGSSKTQLLEQFKQTPGAVLFAVASFWQGVDVVGDALSLVVMDKIPFSPPTDPLFEARAEKLASQGEDAFLSLQLPEAVIQLAQGFGRLIRHRDDRGIVALLDSRVWRRSYGKRVLEAFPAGCTVSTDCTEVARFWTGHGPAAWSLTTAPDVGLDGQNAL